MNDLTKFIIVHPCSSFLTLQPAARAGKPLKENVTATDHEDHERVRGADSIRPRPNVLVTDLGFDRFHF